MAIFKPEVSKSINNYLGICEFGITNFEDKSAQFDWADIFIELTVKQRGSDFDRIIQIKGNLDKEGGKITGGSVLKRLYQFFEEIGCEAGVNIDGDWEDSEGNKITNIANYLNDRFLKHDKDKNGNSNYEPTMDYLAYFYKEQPKVPGGKSYTRAWNKVYKNLAGNKEKLQSDVNWMKSKGYLKEATNEIPVKTEMSGSGLANL
tara:strand:- start:774 stop:1385 length:612 start_codon:yes stop_codon:yes gene_type:complete